ncbi:hypothetical protein KP509_26G043300 [Ceratopteris richardii]|uniref:RING-type E3 ubiquitin transferase n=1 Tax=Ceratopteris richardii TaxID=49495 RepID=A0A8T2RM44_CERRI|nr:hypothetical protein KP509_26G043300 [Ceratopteris richardii]
MDSCNNITRCWRVRPIHYHYEAGFAQDVRVPLASSIIFVLAILAIVCGLLITCIFIKLCYERLPQLPLESNVGDAADRRESIGLKESEIRRLPTICYSSNSANLCSHGDREVSSIDCSICLSDFVEGHYVRVLPTCGHVFHMQCIDTWLSSHCSCPTCRDDVLKCVNQAKDPAIQLDILLQNL